MIVIKEIMMWNKKNRPAIIRKLFTGIEILLVVAILGAAGGGLSSWKNKRALNRTAQQNVEQAVTIDKLATKVQVVNEQKDKAVAQLQDVEEQLKAKASTGFSILYEQSEDIAKEHPSTYTEVHRKTAKDYVKVWGYDAMARIIKWQQDQIEKQLSDTKKLMAEKEILKTQYLEYKIETEKVIGETKSEAENHRRTAEDLKSKVSNFLEENGLLNKLLFWGAIGGGAYLFITFGGIPLFFSAKRKAIAQVQEQLQKEKLKKKDAMKTIKAFKAANDDGNETMDKITKSLGLDLDKDDD
jgi:hypothetical protein